VAARFCIAGVEPAAEVSMDVHGLTRRTRGKGLGRTSRFGRSTIGRMGGWCAVCKGATARDQAHGSPARGSRFGALASREPKCIIPVASVRQDMHQDTLMTLVPA